VRIQLDSPHHGNEASTTRPSAATMAPARQAVVARWMTKDIKTVISD
jgi:hypothetical protein